MNIWNMILCAVRHKRWNGKVEYWDFCIDDWITPEEFSIDCITSNFAAEAFVRDYGGEVVKLKINVEEINPKLDVEIQ